MHVCRGRRTVPDLRLLPLRAMQFDSDKRQRGTDWDRDWAGAGSRGAGLTVEG